MIPRLVFLFILVGAVVACGCDSPPRLTKAEFEKKQQKKEKREGHPFE